jgi:hypothetical protein
MRTHGAIGVGGAGDGEGGSVGGGWESWGRLCCSGGGLGLNEGSDYGEEEKERLHGLLMSK